jgi:hypothetical protein
MPLNAVGWKSTRDNPLLFPNPPMVQREQRNIRFGFAIRQLPAFARRPQMVSRLAQEETAPAGIGSDV